MKIIRASYQASTMSTPAFFDVTLEDGRVFWVQGKAAKRLSFLYHRGSDVDVDDMLERAEWKQSR